MKPINIIALLSGSFLLSSVVCLIGRIMRGPSWLAITAGLLFLAGALIVFIPLGATLLYNAWKKLKGDRKK